MSEENLSVLLGLVAEELSRAKEKLHFTERAVINTLSQNSGAEATPKEGLQSIDSAIQTIDCLGIFLNGILESNAIENLVETDTAMSRVYLEEVRLGLKALNRINIAGSNHAVEVF